jgi:carbon storage regulator CsrA
MLTLTRKPDETIVIGEGSERIEVTIRSVRRNQVRVSVDAPEHVPVYRKELGDDPECIRRRGETVPQSTDD